MDLQKQYDNIYSLFKTTTEQFDYLEWDGNELKIIYKEKIIEYYSIDDLQQLGTELK